VEGWHSGSKYNFTLNSVPHGELYDLVPKVLPWIGNDDGDNSKEDGALESAGNHSPSDGNKDFLILCGIKFISKYSRAQKIQA
jgi:hypothetical protein